MIERFTGPPVDPVTGRVVWERVGPEQRTERPERFSAGDELERLHRKATALTPDEDLLARTMVTRGWVADYEAARRSDDPQERAAAEALEPALRATVQQLAEEAQR